MIHLLFVLVFAEMALVLVLLFKSPLRNLVIKLMDRMKQGRGTIISKTVAATFSVIFISIVYNVIEIQKRAWEGGLLNPTDEVLMANRTLEASLMGFALFLALVTYRLPIFIKGPYQPVRRSKADEEIQKKPHGKHHDHKEHSKKATTSRSNDDTTYKHEDD